MRKNGKKVLIGSTILTAFVIFSNWLAPRAAAVTNLNHYYFLSWGAPALFSEDVDEAGALIKMEPWRMLGMQLPAFASIRPDDWEAISPPADDPINPSDPTVALGGTVGIYHSHASEAFVPTTGKARSADFSETIVQAGRVIGTVLAQNGIKVLHSEEYHDLKYSQSYVHSRKTAKAMLSEEPEISLLIDLHRDGVGKTSLEGRAVTTATVDGKQAGQIMFVISSAHENWEKNNRVANDLHNLLEDKYPGLSRGILSRSNSGYNQDLHSGAVLVEVGGHWNSLEEVLYGAELFADVLVDYLGGA